MEPEWNRPKVRARKEELIGFKFKYFLVRVSLWVINVGAQVKVLQKGKITIPAEIREMLGIKEGDILTLVARGGCIVLLPPRAVLNPTELLDGLVEGVAVKEPIKEDLRKATAARVEEKLGRNDG
ncbi:MAG: AbrB/MazE/SpoVT family DNA-binding domain-containing protein [Candidatus Bathyarchaeia archaeon]